MSTYMNKAFAAQAIYMINNEGSCTGQVHCSNCFIKNECSTLICKGVDYNTSNKFIELAKKYLENVAPSDLLEELL